MIVIERNTDVVGQQQDLEHLFTLKNFPVFMGCVDQPRNEDLNNDMSFHISRSTGMVQLNPVLPLEVIYQSAHNPGTVGASWDEHHRSFAEFIYKYKPKKVFEIGGAHGKLSKYYDQLMPDNDWTIIEPNPVPVPDLRARMINGFYTKDTEIPNDLNMLVHSHVLEHFLDPHEFFLAASKLKLGTFMCFSVPALRRHLEQQFTNTINFEHTYLCTEEFIEWWLQCYGFDVIERQYYQTDHSIFYSAVKTTRLVNISEPPTIYNENRNLINAYLDHHKNLISKINDQIKDADGPVFLFGAHVFSQFLIAFGLDTSNLGCILDNSEAKQNKRLYGTDLYVRSPKILVEFNNPIVILRTGVFDQEIKNDILTNINPNTRFLR